jgi:hypothetical protein
MSDPEVIMRQVLGSAAALVLGCSTLLAHSAQTVEVTATTGEPVVMELGDRELPTLLQASRKD